MKTYMNMFPHSRQLEDLHQTAADVFEIGPRNRLENKNTQYTFVELMYQTL
jgi:hypothetical protein